MYIGSLYNSKSYKEVTIEQVAELVRTTKVKWNKHGKGNNVAPVLCLMPSSKESTVDLDTPCNTFFIDIDTTDRVDDVISLIKAKSSLFDNVRWVQKSLSGKLHVCVEIYTMLETNQEWEEVWDYVNAEFVAKVFSYTGENVWDIENDRTILDTHMRRKCQPLHISNHELWINPDFYGSLTWDKNIEKYAHKLFPTVKGAKKHTSTPYGEHEVVYRGISGTQCDISCLNDTSNHLWPKVVDKRGNTGNNFARVSLGGWIYREGFFQTSAELEVWLNAAGLTRKEYVNDILRGFNTHFGVSLDNAAAIHEFWNNVCVVPKRIKGTLLKRGEYLSNHKTQILSQLTAGHNVVVAPTGTGKTTLVNEICEDSRMATTQVQEDVLLFPTTVPQAKCNIVLIPFHGTENKYYTCAIQGNYNGNRYEVDTENDSQVLMVYDQFMLSHNVVEALVNKYGVDNTTIWVDELHLMYQSHYRKILPSITAALNKYANKGVKVVWLSATPTKDVYGYNSIVFSCQPKNYKINWYKQGTSYKIIDYINYFQPNLVFTKDAKKYYLQLKRKGKDVTLIHTDVKNNLNELIQRGGLLRSREILVGTSLINQGIDINNQERCNIVIDADDVTGEDIIQMIGRLRKSKYFTVSIISYGSDPQFDETYARVAQDYDITVIDVQNEVRFNSRAVELGIVDAIRRTGKVTCDMNIVPGISSCANIKSVGIGNKLVELIANIPENQPLSVVGVSDLVVEHIEQESKLYNNFGEFGEVVACNTFDVDPLVVAVANSVDIMTSLNRILEIRDIINSMFVSATAVAHEYIALFEEINEKYEDNKDHIPFKIAFERVREIIVFIDRAMKSAVNDVVTEQDALAALTETFKYRQLSEEGRESRRKNAQKARKTKQQSKKVKVYLYDGKEVTDAYLEKEFNWKSFKIKSLCREGVLKFVREDKIKTKKQSKNKSVKR